MAHPFVASPTASSSPSEARAPTRGAPQRMAPARTDAGLRPERRALASAAPAFEQTADHFVRGALNAVQAHWGEAQAPAPRALEGLEHAQTRLARQIGRLSTRRGQSPAAARQIAAIVLQAHPKPARALIEQAAAYGAMGPETKHQLLMALTPLSMPVRRARALLEAKLPDRLAVFLAEMEIERGKAINEMLKSWGESLRKWAKLEQEASEKAHREASLVARQQQARLQAKLLELPTVGLRLDGPKLRRVLGLQPSGAALAVEDIGSLPVRGLHLITPAPNNMLQGAFCQPVALGFRVGGPQNEYFYAVIEHAASRAVAR